MRIGVLDYTHAFVDQSPLEEFRHISIFSWQKLVAALDHRHPHPKPAQRLPELATNRPAAKHNHGLRFFLQLVKNGLVREITDLFNPFDFWNDGGGCQSRSQSCAHAVASR